MDDFVEIVELKITDLMQPGLSGPEGWEGKINEVIDNQHDEYSFEGMQILPLAGALPGGMQGSMLAFLRFKKKETSQ